MSETTARGAVPASPIRLLLVDDHDYVLWGLTKLIDGEWPRMMVIGTCTDLTRASVLVHTRKPDVVLVDYYVGGRHALDHVPGWVGPDGPRIILMTPLLNQELQQRAQCYGAQAVVAKDAPAETLLREILKAREGASQQ